MKNGVPKHFTYNRRTGNRLLPEVNLLFPQKAYTDNVFSLVQN